MQKHSRLLKNFNVSIRLRRKVAALMLDEKCLIFPDTTCFSVVKNAAGYHPGAVMTSPTDGAQFFVTFRSS